MADEYPEPTPEPPPPEVEPPEAQAPGVQTITTRTKDYLGRPLRNIATNAIDFLGRTTKVGDLDFMGRALVA